MQRCRTILCLLPGAWALACGGRYQQTVEGDDAPSAGTASGGHRTGEAGGSSRAGSTSRAGSSSGVGGNVGAAGSAATGGSGPACVCDPIGCAPPFRAVPQVGGCCYFCELDLMQCARSSDDYRQLRQQMIDKYNSLGCMIDADCTIYYPQNQCGVASCGLPLLASMVNEVDRNLESYAQSSCSPACPGAPDLPCAPVAPRCLMSRCQ